MAIQRQKTPHPTQPVQIHAKQPLTCRVILLLADNPLSPDNTANRVQLRVCQWSGQSQPGLESRRAYVSRKDGRVTYRGNRSLTLDDMRIISCRWEEVLNALQG